MLSWCKDTKNKTTIPLFSKNYQSFRQFLLHPRPAVTSNDGRNRVHAHLNLSELSTTLTLEKAIRALAHIGVIWKSMPKM